MNKNNDSNYVYNYKLYLIFKILHLFYGERKIKLCEIYN